MTRARSELVLDMPFFAHLALRLDMRPDPTCATAWTDGKTMAFNPEYIHAMPLEKVKGMQCHEVLHLACNHHTRRGERDKATWNRACDYAINPILLDTGLELPTGYLDDPKFHGKGAEDIYSELVDIDRERHDFYTDGHKDADGEEEPLDENAATTQDGDEQHQSERSDQTEDADTDGEGPAPGKHDNDDTEDDNDDTGGQTDDPGMTGEVRDADSESGGADAPREQAEEEQSWREAVSQAVQKQREAGDVPGALARLLKEHAPPTLAWSEILRRFIARAARNDFSWTRPNRRYLHMGLYLPGLHNEELDEVVVVLDTSGSVDECELSGFTSELTALLEDFNAAVTLMTCDAKVTLMRRLTRADLPLSLSPSGGGGTDFRPPFQHLDEEMVAPSCLIYFSDMNCRSYPEEPAFPVLWVTPSHDFDKPPFGEVVRMEVSRCA